jgi:transposase
MFESGRHLAAWAGLTPKERSTGGKQRMGGISRAGNERLRKPRKLAAVALANKMARTAWAMMTSGETYRRPSIAAGAVAA